jgi:ribonucleoside-diphosphate reductase alpha chain
MIDLQPASYDVWNSKYRLRDWNGQPIDQSIEDMFRRVAKGIAEVEATKTKRREWEKRFFWALTNGAIPAGRILANVGAQSYKPNTSTINCTVSGTIEDSMHGILTRLYEAGITLKGGSGIGYEFSTLRPRGAFVAGAGAYTSGPLSFMDIYDKTCFTVSSAGGRRGAQMATFDVSHPDVREFIRAKRENGRLRQFNLSLLVTDEFLRAVEQDLDWQLVFPVHPKEANRLDFQDPRQVVWRDWPITEGYITREDGKVACKVYGTIRARRLWDVIMNSTYDYAEPGFILIDRVNEMNNNWWCENIRATNPCVTADTWVQTVHGPRQVRDLVGTPFKPVIDGRDFRSTPVGFFRTGRKPVFRLRTKEGYTLRATHDHRILVRLESGDFVWKEVGSLVPGDRVALNDLRAIPNWSGNGLREEGVAIGLALACGEGQLGTVELRVTKNTVFGEVAHEQIATAVNAIRSLRGGGPCRFDIAPEYRISSRALYDTCLRYGVNPIHLLPGPNLEKTSHEFHVGLVRGYATSRVRVHLSANPTIRISLREPLHGEILQRMLLRLGIVCRRNETEIVIDHASASRYAKLIGLADKKAEATLLDLSSSVPEPHFYATVSLIEEDGIEDVFDATVEDAHAFDANGIIVHNCGEQPLPPYGACLLGSVNLTRFVRDPFTSRAKFDWETFREVVRVFTRMLDNVVEINGLPLPQQQAEILSKRRHGMGFLGLGSTLTLLGMRYGSPESVDFTRKVTYEMAVTGWEVGLELAKEKGPAPILAEKFTVTPAMLAKRPEMAKDGIRAGDVIEGRVLHARYSRYMQKIAARRPELIDELARHGSRFTHHTSIAPTGTISLSLGNNASNGIEPTFAHQYYRNIIREGKKTKEQVEVLSYELLLYRNLVNPKAKPYSEKPDEKLPDYFSTSETVTPDEHVAIQAAAQEWVDSSISKTVNVPANFSYDQFKDVYLKAWKAGLKGCTTFRPNPEALQGVLVTERDLANTTYRFTLEDGSVVEAKGNDAVFYDGETHTAANLYEALKEGYYGRF